MSRLTEVATDMSVIGGSCRKPTGPSAEPFGAAPLGGRAVFLRLGPDKIHYISSTVPGWRICCHVLELRDGNRQDP